MPTTPTRPHTQRHNAHVFVFLAVLATGIILIALGVPVGSLGTVSVALSGLYTAYTAATPRSTDDTPDAPRSDE